MNAISACYYAIRHMPTGALMSLSEDGFPRGSSHWDPEVEHLRCRVPRLFLSERSARAALRAWLAGRWLAVEGRNYWEHGEIYRPEPDPARRAEDMRIVAFRLAEVVR